MIRSQGLLREGKLWQRNYYEHIIRNDESLMRIREYIQMNPLRWEYDGENPSVNRAPGMKPYLEWQDVLYGATHASPDNIGGESGRKRARHASPLQKFNKPTIFDVP